MSIKAIWQGQTPTRTAEAGGETSASADGNEPTAEASNGDSFGQTQGEDRLLPVPSVAEASTQQVTFRPRRRKVPKAETPKVNSAVPDAESVPYSRLVDPSEDRDFFDHMFDYARQTDELKISEVGADYVFAAPDYCNRFLVSDHGGEAQIYEGVEGRARIPKNWLRSTKKWSVVAASCSTPTQYTSPRWAAHLRASGLEGRE